MSFSFLDVDASNQVEERTAARHAAVLANSRVASSFDTFLDASSSPEERKHRMAYIESDVQAVIAAVCDETGHVDVEGLTSAILDRLSKGAFCDDCRKWGDACVCGDDKKDKKDGDKDGPAVEEESDLVPGDEDSKESSFRVAWGNPGDGREGLEHELGVAPGPHHPGQFDHTNPDAYHDGPCLTCGAPIAPGEQVCEHCGTPVGGYNDADSLFGGDHGPMDSPGGDSEMDFPRQGKLARRPKLCPYHSELIDASLQTGKPEYAAFASLVGTPSHCKGGFDGSCNFKPAMVAQTYWDDRKQQYEENRLERERQQEESYNTLEQVGPTEIVDAPDNLTDTDDISTQLADSPSAVGASEAAPALASVHTAEGEPSPKMDKTKWKPNALNPDGNLPVIDTDGGRYKTEHQDVTNKADHEKDFLEQTDEVAEHGVDVGKEHTTEAIHTDTWSGTDGQAKPVTSNRIREFFAQGFTPRDEALKAITEFESQPG